MLDARHAIRLSHYPQGQPFPVLLRAKHRKSGRIPVFYLSTSRNPANPGRADAAFCPSLD